MERNHSFLLFYPSTLPLSLSQERYQYAKQILKENQPALHRIAEALMEYETLSGDEIKLLAQGKPLKKEL